MDHLDRTIADADPGDWPALAVAIAARLATIASFMLTPSADGSQSADSVESGDRYVTPEQAAEIAGVTRRWIFQHTRGERFRKNLSRKQVRLHEAGFRRWLATRASPFARTTDVR